MIPYRDTSMATANAEIKAGGTYVGGITGYNAGQIQNKRNVNDSEDFEFFTIYRQYNRR